MTKLLPLRKILCPTDFSTASYAAADVAVELAQQFNADLIALHVVAPLPVVAEPEAAASIHANGYLEELTKSAQRSMGELQRDRLAKAPEVRAEVTHGGAADEIVRQAEEREVDLIVIATHGQTGWRRLVFGSVAEKVARLASCAVLIVQAPH